MRLFNRSIVTAAGITMLTHSLTAIGQEKQTTLAFHVIAAPEWTDVFRRESGWLGGDGLFSIPLNGVDTIGGSVATETRGCLQ